METAYGVKIHATKTMREGERIWSVPSFAYYAVRRNGQLQQTTNHYQATLMTRALVDELVVKLTAAGIQATPCDLFADPDAAICTSLVEIGEEAPPPASPPTSLARLAAAIEDCLHENLTPLEVINHCNRCVLLG